MRSLLAALILLTVAVANSCAAQEFGRPMAQVALQPLPDTAPPDIEAVLKAHWKAYYNGTGEFGFFRDQVRAGRIDLNEDNRAELVLLIDSPAWHSDKGFPMVVCQWTTKGWSAIGWTYGEPDGVFATSGRVEGWATIETPTQWLRWNGASYQALDRPPP